MQRRQNALLGIIFGGLLVVVQWCINSSQKEIVKNEDSDDPLGFYKE